MIRNNKLDIKIAIPSNLFDASKNNDYSTERAIFHQKIGILEDADGHIISFSGSINESVMDWNYNIEVFKVFRSWINGEGDHLQSDLKKFENLWSNTAKNIHVCNIPDVVKKKIISISPIDFNEIKPRLERDTNLPVRLREYQLTAVQSWLNSKKGLIGMATGTEKTFVAIVCMKEIIKREKRLAVVITCPFLHLIE